MADPVSAYIFYAGFLILVALAAQRFYSDLTAIAEEEEGAVGPPPVDRYWKDYYAHMKSFYAANQVMPSVADRRHLNPLGYEAGGWREGHTQGPMV